MDNGSNRTGALAVAAVCLSCCATQALAALPLQGRTITGSKVAADDPGAVMEYDPNQNLTWLRDWNASGEQDLRDQVRWAAGLTVGTFSGWALPSALNQNGSGPCEGHGCTSTSMGYLWYEILGNSADVFTNGGPFQNFALTSGFHATSTPDPRAAGWAFSTTYGAQALWDSGPLYAVAIRLGDVAAVPDANTLALLLLGLGVVALAIRRDAA